MKEKTKKIIAFSALFVIALTYFILAIFVFQAPNGLIGYLLCMASLSAIIISVVKLYQYTSGKGMAEAIIDAIIIFLFG